MAVNSIFILTRYSVFEAGNWHAQANAPKGSRGWILLANAESVEDYKQSLFSDERLDARLGLFKRITAESLAGQVPCEADLYFVILTSDELPTEHRAKLDAVLRDIEERSDFTCVVVEVPADGDFGECADTFLDDHFAGGPDQRFATVRLDDDDALGASFCQRLSAHLDQGLCGYPVSFAYGYEGVVDPDGRISDLRHWNFPKISAGLAFTNAWSSSGGYADPRRHVHSLGRHIKVDVADALVLDTRAPAYFKTVNEHMDTGGRQAFATDLPAVTRRDFAVEEFPWMKDSLDLPAGDDATSEVFDPATATSARARHQRAERKLKQEIRTLKKQLKAASQAGQRRPGRLKRVRGRIARRLRGT